MTRHVALSALLGLVAGLVVAACASAPSREPGAAYAPLDARKDDIRDLWMQIRGWRVELGMNVDPQPVERALQAKPVNALRHCAIADDDAAEGTCADVCNLKDAICDNADSICRIADELDGDAWADDKCKSAKSSCKEATDRCCACAGEAPPADLDARP